MSTKKKEPYKPKTPQERLEAGETFVNSEPGNSMTPILKSRQRVVLAPWKWEDCEPNISTHTK